MENGVLQGENFAAVLRSISQRRRQGVLEIEEEGAPKRVFFVAGKIVEFTSGDTPAAYEVAERLKNAGYIRSMEGLPTGNYQALFDALMAQGKSVDVDLEVFRRAIKHRILDNIYALNTKSGAPYKFNVQITDYEKDLAPAIPAGQVLLDIVALGAEEERFAIAFPEGAVVEPALEEEGGQGEDEELIYSLAKQRLPVETLRLRSMLSTYAFQETLLNLLDRGVLRKGEVAEATPGSEQLFGAEALSGIDRTIDQTFGAEEAPEGIGQEEAIKGAGVVQTPDRIAALDAGMHARLRLWSAMALQEAWVPRALAYIIVVAAILLPALFWQGLIAGFGR